MSKVIRFTNHARQKFADLAEVGFVVTEEQVLETVRNPEHVDQRVDPPVAQKAISARHLIRVAFVEEADEIRIVTFYPVRRSRYEPEDEI
jgi:hypothetical protein